MASFDQVTWRLREDIQTAVQDYRTLTATMQSEREMEEGTGGVAEGRDESDEGRDESDEQRLLLAQKEALRYQSLEELRSVCTLTLPLC